MPRTTAQTAGDSAHADVVVDMIRVDGKPWNSCQRLRDRAVARRLDLVRGDDLDDRGGVGRGLSNLGSYRRLNQLP